MPPANNAGGEARLALGAGIGCYLIWGFVPLVFQAINRLGVGPWEILAHRILWTLAFCAVVLLVRRDLGWIRPFLARRRLVAGITVAAFLIAGNWVIYVLAVITGRTYEAALGYFLNPIVTVALGVVVLGERLRPLQWVAVAVGAVAAVYLTVAGGVLPWISLTLAFSFGLYGLVKKKVGASLEAMHSLAAETGVLAPVAVAVIVVGQALLLGRSTLLVYAAVFGVAVATFVHGYEEPTLARRFGAQYEDYRRAVRAWWPRWTPWEPGSRTEPARGAGRGEVRR